MNRSARMVLASGATAIVCVAGTAGCTSIGPHHLSFATNECHVNGYMLPTAAFTYTEDLGPSTTTVTFRSGDPSVTVQLGTMGEEFHALRPPQALRNGVLVVSFPSDGAIGFFNFGNSSYPLPVGCNGTWLPNHNTVGIWQ